MRRVIITFGLLAVVVQSAWAVESGTNSEDVALVNGHSIARDAFVRHLITDHGQAVLRQMVAVALVEQEARRLGISVDAEVADRYINQLLRERVAAREALKKRFFERAIAEIRQRRGDGRVGSVLKSLKGQSLEDLDKILRRHDLGAIADDFIDKGYTIENVDATMKSSVGTAVLRAEARKGLLLRQILKEQLQVSDQEMQQYYRLPQVYPRYNEPTLYAVHQIVVANRGDADAVYSKLRESTSEGSRKLANTFTRLVDDFSVSAGKETKGAPGGNRRKATGFLGYVTETDLPLELRLAVRNSERGDILPPIPVRDFRRQRFWFIVWVRDVKKGKKAGLDWTRVPLDVKEELHTDLVGMKLGEEGVKYVEQLHRKAEIKILVKFD